ncbi:hypothetical protein BGZ63DRAFT_423030 [Mariannaea sp. PMI_226]|nr:hypothetical protein BGZ63DRAFT_423030 [Mariannaea sp. PMI_226]
MSSDVLNFNKPCSACRRRKVKCDKSQPCNNCTRHRVTCVYEAPRESAMSQQLLQDRVDRLERMVEDLTAYSMSNSVSGSHRKSTSSSSNSPFSNFDDFNDIPSDAGSQVFHSSNSYYMGPNSWMNVNQLGPGQQHLLHMCSQDRPGERSAWSMTMLQSHSPSQQQQQQQQSPPPPKDLTHFHLPIQKEDILMGLFFDHVEPWIRVNHQPYFWQMVGDFRHGTCLPGRDVEALMFSSQYITAAVLPAGLLQEKLGVTKPELVNHLQQAAELAFDQANLMRSRSVILLSALLYYITAQFHTGNCEAGSTLLGLASSIARRMGMHREPAYYGYGPWCIEMRRRMWGHLATLDAQACSADGSESVLTSISDVQRSFNLDDNDFQLPRFVQQHQTEPGPRDCEGYSEATAALIRREICRTANAISEARRSAVNCYDLMAIVEEAVKYIRLKFVHHFDGSDPMQHVISKWYNAMIKSLTVSVLYSHASTSGPRLQCHAYEQLQERLYEDCLVCLEELTQGEKAATPYHWQWAFRWPMPFHVIAGMLSCLASLPDHRDTDRAWEQIDAAFRRYNNNDVTMAKMPAWYSIELLCDQAMVLHPNQKHEGRAYAKRIHTPQPRPHSQQQRQHSHHQLATGNETHNAQIHQKGLGLGGISVSVMPCPGVYGIDIYDESLRKHHSMVEVTETADPMNMGFPDNDIDNVFFNANADDEYLSIDV